MAIMTPPDNRLSRVHRGRNADDWNRTKRNGRPGAISCRTPLSRQQRHLGLRLNDSTAILVRTGRALRAVPMGSMRDPVHFGAVSLNSFPDAVGVFNVGDWSAAGAAFPNSRWAVRPRAGRHDRHRSRTRNLLTQATSSPTFDREAQLYGTSATARNVAKSDTKSAPASKLHVNNTTAAPYLPPVSVP
jgi:hypothetical protein